MYSLTAMHAPLLRSIFEDPPLLVKVNKRSHQNGNQKTKYVNKIKHHHQKRSKTEVR